MTDAITVPWPARVGSVVVAVVGVLAGQEVRREVCVRTVDAGVDHRHRHPRAARLLPHRQNVEPGDCCCRAERPHGVAAEREALQQPERAVPSVRQRVGAARLHEPRRAVVVVRAVRSGGPERPGRGAAVNGRSPAHRPTERRASGAVPAGRGGRNGASFSAWHRHLLASPTASFSHRTSPERGTTKSPRRLDFRPALGGRALRTMSPYTTNSHHASPGMGTWRGGSWKSHA